MLRPIPRLPWPFLVIAIWALALLTSCDDDLGPKPTPEVVLTGLWIGSIGDSLLELDLVELPGDTLSGTVTVSLGDKTTTYPVQRGIRAPTPDSLFVEFDSQALRQQRWLWGKIWNQNEISGRYLHHVRYESAEWGVWEVMKADALARSN